MLNSFQHLNFKTLKLACAEHGRSFHGDNKWFTDKPSTVNTKLKLWE